MFFFRFFMSIQDIIRYAQDSKVRLFAKQLQKFSTTPSRLALFSLILHNIIFKKR